MKLLSRLHERSNIPPHKIVNMKKKIFLALIILLFLLALSRFDMQALLLSVKQISLQPVLFLLGLQIVSQLLVNFQWYKIAGLTNTHINFSDMFRINCQGAVMDSITPGVKVGGEITRAVLISRTGNCSGEQAAAIVALQKLFSLSASFFISLFALGSLAGNIPLFQARYVQFFIYGVLAVFLLMFLGIFLLPRRLKAYLLTKKEPHCARIAKLNRFFLTLLDHVIAIRQRTGITLLLFLLSLLIWLVYPVKMYILAIQIFPGASAMYLGAIAYVSYMAAMLPIFPGGLGGFEGTMTGLLLAIGFLHSDAFVLTVLFRFVTFWFVLLLSLTFIAGSKMQLSFFPFTSSLSKVLHRKKL